MDPQHPLCIFYEVDILYFYTATHSYSSNGSSIFNTKFESQVKWLLLLEKMQFSFLPRTSSISWEQQFTLWISAVRTEFQETILKPPKPHLAKNASWRKSTWNYGTLCKLEKGLWISTSLKLYLQVTNFLQDATLNSALNSVFNKKTNHSWLT